MKKRIKPEGPSWPRENAAFLLRSLPSVRLSYSGLRPILDTQPRHPAEFLVGAHEGQPVGPGNGRDLEVVGSDDPALKLQLVPDFGIMPSGCVVKRKRCEWCEEHVQSAPPTLAVAVL